MERTHSLTSFSDDDPEVLHLSEAEAYLRIAAARAAREHPLLLTMLADGRLHLTAIAKLGPHLTLENREALLERAAHRTRREIEELVAEISPRPDVPAVMCVRREALRSIANSVRTELARVSPRWSSPSPPTATRSYGELSIRPYMESDQLWGVRRR
jgi:hypothetical protein